MSTSLFKQATALLPSLPQPLAAHPIAVGLIASLVTLIAVAYLYLYTYREYTLTFKNLRGPAATTFFLGNLTEIINAPPGEIHAKWMDTYGPTLRYRLLAGSARLFTADPIALSYILSHSDDFIKPEQSRRALVRMLGNGVLVAEGHEHRRQRRVLNPAFGPAAVRDMVPIFWDKAYELQRKVMSFVEDDSLAGEAAPTPAVEIDVVPGARKIDMMKVLSQATLDVIGLAGFNYDFASLSQPHNELAEAYRQMFSAGQEITVMAVLQAFVPFFDRIPTKRQSIMDSSSQITRRIGQKLIDDKKKAIAAVHSGELEKGTDIGKDLLSHLIRANMASDIRPDQRLSDDEVLAQITTFMLAGNETSSTALTWALYELSKRPEMQNRLRAEVLAVEEDRPSLEIITALPFLEKVVREVLRFSSPVPSTIREAGADAIVPLGTPVRGRDGSMVESVRIKKGTQIFIPINNVNKSKSIWGPDAGEFNPDRFDKSDIEHIPGVWGNLLTFLGGARNCIGYRLALAEIKVILFVLLRTFVFEELPSKPEIERKTAIVMRPRVIGEKDAGLQMPLLVRPLSAS